MSDPFSTEKKNFEPKNIPEEEPDDGEDIDYDEEDDEEYDEEELDDFIVDDEYDEDENAEDSVFIHDEDDDEEKIPDDLLHQMANKNMLRDDLPEKDVPHQHKPIPDTSGYKQAYDTSRDDPLRQEAYKTSSEKDEPKKPTEGEIMEMRAQLLLYIQEGKIQIKRDVFELSYEELKTYLAAIQKIDNLKKQAASKVMSEKVMRYCLVGAYFMIEKAGEWIGQDLEGLTKYEYQCIEDGEYSIYLDRIYEEYLKVKMMENPLIALVVCMVAKTLFFMFQKSMQTFFEQKLANMMSSGDDLSFDPSVLMGDFLKNAFPNGKPSQNTPFTQGYNGGASFDSDDEPRVQEMEPDDGKEEI